MPSVVSSTQLLPELHCEQVVITNDIGQTFQGYIYFSEASQRETLIQGWLATMNTQETQAQAYMAAIPAVVDSQS